MNSFSTDSVIDRDMFSFLGLTSLSIFGNYNLSFFVLCLVPFAIGLAVLLSLKLQA